MCADIATETDLRVALDELADLVAGQHFDLADGEQAERRKIRDSVLWTIREYLIPKLGELDAPATAVIIGSTGAGKSTLINGLAQARISRPGVVRPTTRHPTVWCHRDAAPRYRGGDFLTGYDGGGTRTLDVVASADPLVDGLTVIDAPDFDSVEEAHRQVADELLAIADVAIFVTSAQRYADAVPWEFIATAQARSLPTRFVLNRVPTGPGVAEIVVDDFRSRLTAGGVAVDDVYVILEQDLDPTHGGLPDAAAAPIRADLARLSDRSVRARLVRDAITGAAEDAARRAEELADRAEDERAAIDLLKGSVTGAYRDQMGEISAALAAGTLIRAEVVRRWQQYVGTGELLKALTDGLGRVRGWLRRVAGGTGGLAETPVGREAEAELAAGVARRADRAARAAATAWELHPAGPSLLRGGDLWHRDPATDARVEQAVEAWMAELPALIERHGGDKKRFAKLASIGINAAALTLLLGVFVSTGGLTGAEVGVAAGAAAAQQTVLEHIFGAQAARALARSARSRLEERLEEVLAADARRFHDVLEGIRPTAPEALRNAAGRVHEELRGWNRA